MRVYERCWEFNPVDGHTQNYGYRHKVWDPDTYRGHGHTHKNTDGQAYDRQALKSWTHTQNKGHTHKSQARTNNRHTNHGHTHYGRT